MSSGGRRKSQETEERIISMRQEHEAVITGTGGRARRKKRGA